ncbi:helix-turn-helix domain-containing protein [Nocardia sp. NPDC056064]|uniref:helix-turn-helix domain-containing protein n=1 Tax=Nocardia sp. NPDC056064 TaxID=3345701 RepID=UPI0035E0B81F
MASLVRAVRKQRGLTLDDLAARTGLTKSYLSKVERGRSTPSIAVAIKVAAALEVEVGQLFAADSESQNFVLDRAPRDGDEPEHLRVLAAQMLGKSMEPFVLDPRRSDADLDHSEHPGQELVYVLAGSIDLHYGDQVATMEQGDSAYFDSAVAHRIRARGRAKAQVLVVVHNQPGG